MLGYGVAQGLQLKPGDHVTLLANTLEGALNSMEFEVIGVFQSFFNDYDARAIRIPLAAAQELLETQGANALVVLLKDTNDTNRIATQLNEQFRPEGLEVKTWVELNDYYEKTVELYRHQFGALQLIILVMVLLSVANSVNTSVFERVGEFGTMMALGNRREQIFWLIMTEKRAAWCNWQQPRTRARRSARAAISAIGIPMPPPPTASLGYIGHIQIIPSALLTSFVIGFGASSLAAILPARHVSRKPVVEALRQNF